MPSGRNDPRHSHGLTIRSVAQIRKNAAAASVEFDATGGVLYAGHLRMPFVALYVNLNLNNKRGRISFALKTKFWNDLDPTKNLLFCL